MPSVLLLLLVQLCAGSVLAAEVPPVEVMGLLGSRELVATVIFPPGEQHLDSRAKVELDGITPRLTAAGRHSKLIRIEGFPSRKETSPEFLARSMARARAVEVYLREVRKITSDIYLIAHDRSHATQEDAKVEVVLYDTLLPIGDAPIDDIIKEW